MGLSFSWQAGEAYYLPIRPGRSARLNERQTLDALRPHLTGPAIEKVTDMKYDMFVLGRAGSRDDRSVTDTMILSYLLESGERNHSLDQLSQRLLDHEMIPITDLIGKGKNQITMDRVAVGRSPNTPARTPTPPGGSRKSSPQGRERGAVGPLCRPGEAVDLGPDPDGRGRDRRRCAAAQTTLSRIRRSAGRVIENRSMRPAGHTFNINSGPQLRQVLFEELKLPSLQKTPGGEQSTAQDVLEELALKHPFPALLEHRQLSKLKGTYLDALPALCIREMVGSMLRSTRWWRRPAG